MRKSKRFVFPHTSSSSGSSSCSSAALQKAAKIDNWKKYLLRAALAYICPQQQQRDRVLRGVFADGCVLCVCVWRAHPVCHIQENMFANEYRGAQAQAMAMPSSLSPRGDIMDAAAAQRAPTASPMPARGLLFLRDQWESPWASFHLFS